MHVMKPDEELLWYDRPSPWCVAIVPLIRSLFMSGWTALAVTVTFLALRELNTGTAPGILHVTALAGAALSAFGFVVLVWNIWLLIAARHTFYGLSDGRLIILKSLWPGNVLSLRRGWLTGIAESNKGPCPSLVLSGRGNSRQMPDRVRLWVRAERQAVMEAIRNTLSP